MSLAGKNLVITGAFGSLGAAVVRAAIAEGATVAALDRAAVPAQATLLNGARLYGGVDAGDPEACRVIMTQIAGDLGGIDALVNIAGSFRWETVQDGSIDTWDFLYNINLRTAVATSQAALPYLLQRPPAARIVNVGAAGAIKAAAGMGAYAASKAGIAKLTEALADELKDQGVTVNAVLPSIIDTAPNRADMKDADYSRWVSVEQLADIIMFLLSSKSQAITGALIPVVGRV